MDKISIFLWCAAFFAAGEIVGAIAVLFFMGAFRKGDGVGAPPDNQPEVNLDGMFVQEVTHDYTGKVISIKRGMAQ